METDEHSKPKILKLDIAGLPLKWLNWEDAATLYCREKVAWEAGSVKVRVKGGINRISGERSTLAIDTIIAVNDRSHVVRDASVPPLNNRELFYRDHFTCLYCGHRFRPGDLTRDHVVPVSRGGADSWTNVVTACRRCNHRKSHYSPEEAGMKLLAVPYAPNHAEYLILSNRKILADQMCFLHKLVPEKRRDKFALDAAES